jgi:hypothetical protein
MTVSFYPKRLLATALFILAFGSILSLATDMSQGAAVGALALSAYLFVELLVTFNPAVWWRERRRPTTGRSAAALSRLQRER